MIEKKRDVEKWFEKADEDIRTAEKLLLNNMKKIIVSFFFLLSSVFSYSQEVEMADELRSSGKIYVVVGILVTIMLGIILFLIMIDRKVIDIEKKIKK